MHLELEYQTTPMERIEQLSKPMKLLLGERRKQIITKNPESQRGHELLRAKYSLPKPNLFKYGRAQGGINTIELDKLGIGTVRKDRLNAPKRILPKKFRDDPFADAPAIHQSDLNSGMFNLVNRGLIPRDVDVSPAFDRGSPALVHNQSRIHIPDKIKPRHLQAAVSKVKLSARKMLPGRANDDLPYFAGPFTLPEAEEEPDASFHRHATFLTMLDVS
jgi:hypothetical protein